MPTETISPVAPLNLSHPAPDAAAALPDIAPESLTGKRHEPFAGKSQEPFAGKCHGWRWFVGIYADSPDFDAVEQVGRAWRDADRPGAESPAEEAA